MGRKRLLKICFATRFGSRYSMAGAERQTLLIARGLIEKGFEVSLLTMTEPPDNRDPAWDEIPRHTLRTGQIQGGSLHKRAKLARLLSMINADVYVQRAMGSISGTIGPFCRLANKRFVYHSASNFEVSLGSVYSLTRSIGGSLSFFSGLMCADVILAQTEDIAKAFRRTLGPQKKVRVVPQIYIDDFHKSGSRRGRFVLWVSRLIWYKQPFLFIEAARRLGDIQFVMVGSGPLEALVRERAKSVKNLRYLGAQTHKEVEKLCSRAAVFANTSTFEGFPNTFLECASKATPIVTLFYDPDEVICKFGMGIHSRTFDQFVKDIQLLTENDEARRRMGANGQEYVKKHNAPERVINLYEQLLESF